MNFENAYEMVLFPSDQSPGVGGQGVWPGHCALGVHYSADDEDDVIPFCSDTKTPKKGQGHIIMVQRDFVQIRCAKIVLYFFVRCETQKK